MLDLYTVVLLKAMSVRVIPQTAMQLHFHNTAAESRSRLHRPQALIVTSLQLSATAQLFGENFDEAPTSHKKEPLNVRQIWLLSSQSLVPSKTFLLSFTAVRGGMQQHLHQQQAQKAMGGGSPAPAKNICAQRSGGQAQDRLRRGHGCTHTLPAECPRE